MFWVIVGFVLAVSIGWSLYKYFTTGRDTEAELYVPSSTFDSPVLDSTPENTTRIYDSHGTLIFGQQDNTEDLDMWPFDGPNEVDDDTA